MSLDEDEPSNELHSGDVTDYRGFLLLLVDITQHLCDIISGRSQEKHSHAAGSFFLHVAMEI